MGPPTSQQCIVLPCWHAKELSYMKAQGKEVAGTLCKVWEEFTGWTEQGKKVLITRRGNEDFNQNTAL